MVPSPGCLVMAFPGHPAVLPMKHPDMAFLKHPLCHLHDAHCGTPGALGHGIPRHLAGASLVHPAVASLEHPTVPSLGHPSTIRVLSHCHPCLMGART